MPFTHPNNVHHGVYNPGPKQSVILPYIANPGALGTFTMTNNTCVAYPVSLFTQGLMPQSFTVHTNAAASAGAVIFGGMWADNVGQSPGLLLADCFPPVAATAANSDITITLNWRNGVEPMASGRYWIGIVQQGAPSPNNIVLNAAPATSVLGTVLPASASSGLSGNPVIGATVSVTNPGIFAAAILSWSPLVAGAAGTFHPLVALNF